MSYTPLTGPISVTGALTDAQLRASAVAVSGAFYPPTQPVSGSVGVSNFPASQAVTGTFWPATQPVSGTFWQATQPVSIAGTVAVSGPLTDAQLRASAVPVSGTFYPATQPVSIASMPSTPVTGTFWQTTQPVSGTVTANAGTGTFAVSGPLTDTQLRATAVPISGSVSVSNFPATQAVSGTFWQATQPVSIAATVAVSGPLTDAQIRASALPVSAPVLTKGAQGANGFTTQDLKDAGRVLFSAATVIGGVTAVTTEALLSLVATRDGVAAGAATTLAVTNGKKLRILAIVCGTRSTAATVLSGRIALRINPTGAVTATSPILAIASMSQQAAALAEAGDTCVVNIPGGIEISGTMQIGLSQVCSGAGGVVYASMIGYEY